MSQTPDALFPSSNALGIPDLDASMQGDFFDYPLAYGSVRRASEYKGHTIHFYVDDYRFNALGAAVEHGATWWKLWERPDKVWQSGAPSFAEVNFSTSQAQPYAVALWQTYKKRYLARYWQERGMRCWVDLNVAPRWAELNLTGVPLGRTAYATRVHMGEDGSALIAQAELAECHAGTSNIKFAVYGHSKAIEALCARQGWLYIPEDWGARDRAKVEKRKALQVEKLRVHACSH